MDILVRLAEWVNLKADKMPAIQKNLSCAGGKTRTEKLLTT
jgi:hypothetical protein